MIKNAAKSVAIGIGIVLVVLLGIGSVLWFEQESYKCFRVEEQKNNTPF